MTLWLIGLGLHDEKDVSVRGLEVIKRASRVFLENYTSILHVPVERLCSFYGRHVEVADREMVESFAEVILDAAEGADAEVAFLVVGDPFGATTHSDLLLRAEARGIPVQVIHNASIMNAVAACGLQLYSFGQTISIPFFTPNWRPHSFYPRIRTNYWQSRAHTLCLLDIKVKEVSEENLARGRMNVYEAPRFMTVSQALEQLCECEEVYLRAASASVSASEDEDEVNSNEPDTPLPCAEKPIIHKDSLVIGLARVGAPDQLICAGSVAELLETNFGPPLHALVIPGPDLHELEFEVLRRMFMSPESRFKEMKFEEFVAERAKF